MLETIREGVKKPWVKIVVFAIVISFIFAGYFSTSFFLGDPNAVAIVNGESITRNEFQRGYQSFKAQQADYYNANVKTQEDERNFQENVLQRLITFKVREQAAKELGLRVSPDRLRELIQDDPNYQMDGRYSSALVEQTLVRAGMTREGFKQAYANQETDRQLMSGVLETEFSLQGEAQRDYAITGQQRSGKALQVNYAPFREKLEVSEEDISTYYDENQEMFRVEEKVSVEYVELSIDVLQAGQTVSEEELVQFYEEVQGRFKTDDQRQISHILILSENGEAEAEAKINAIKARIDAGEDFAAIASTESDDIPTRETGGDLGVLIPGAMEESFETAASALENVGDVSAPVKSNFGYHLIKLTGFVEGSVQPLDSVRVELTAELQKSKAEEQYLSQFTKLETSAFEVADSLEQAAESTGLPIQTSPFFGRNSREGIFANQALKDAAFSSDVKDALLNSSPIEIGENHVVVLRLKEHQPSEVQPLETVKDRVVTSLKQSQAKEKANELADEIVAKAKAKEPIDELITANQLAWVDLDKLERNNASLSFLSSQKFFQMQAPEDGEVTWDLVEDFQGYTVLMLNQVVEGDWSKADAAMMNQRGLYISSYFANAEFISFIEDMRKHSDIKLNLDNLPQ